MPGITNPAEEYFKDGLWAWDPAGGVWKKLIIDPLTNRLVIDHPGDLEVVQPTPADLCVANHGWDGSAWHKVPMIWGFSGTYGEVVSNLNTGAGPVYLQGTQVADGEVWVVYAVEALNTITNITGIRIGARLSATDVFIFAQDVDAIGERVDWGGQMVLAKDDRVRVLFEGCVAGDDIYAVILGYKMKIAE